MAELAELRLESNLGSLTLRPQIGSAGTADEGGGLSGMVLSLLRPHVTTTVGGFKILDVAPAGPPAPRLAALPIWVAPAALVALLFGVGWMIGRR